MPTDYRALLEENKRRYGTDIARIGPMLLANRYDSRAHFIFELLQNAEDALRRRPDASDPRSVRFELSGFELRVSHFGAPFTEDDVRGICGIDQSTKDLTSIGRFGIGFKSVYAFTDRPEVHSAGEHFAIESYVWPTAVPPCEARPGETVFILPLAPADTAAHGEISAGLERIGPRALLFLRAIEEISWAIQDGPSGRYFRSRPQQIGTDARKIRLTCEESGRDPIEETWLVFDREIRVEGDLVVGHVEVAFLLKGEAPNQRVEPIRDSRLVVFFPTVLPTNLGVMVQGPYRTTPSRDNVPANDAWNQDLVRKTATLLVDAIEGLRAMGLLDARALRSLPIDPRVFSGAQMFAPVHDAVREAMRTRPLLPVVGGGHRTAAEVRLARTQELRALLSPQQLGALFGAGRDIFWVTEEITQDREPELRAYLMQTLNVQEITPETLLPRLTAPFLEAQGDEWVLQLYEFLQGQPALLRQDRIRDMPLVRCEDGRHVPARKNGQPQAFLPGSAKTGFPTVRAGVCASAAARAFLAGLGLTVPDLVDDVVRNVLPKYAGEEVDVEDEQYEDDVGRILSAFATDSKAQREKLVSALRNSAFVMSIDAGNGSEWVSRPGDVYVATERLKELFDGVPGLLLVDERYACLRGEEVRELLEACGATGYLQPVEVASRLSQEELREMRRRSGAERNTGVENVRDYTLRGLPALLYQFPKLTPEQALKKALLLWEALRDLHDRRGSGTFHGSYEWFYVTRRTCAFDAKFLGELNSAAWVPNASGQLRPPGSVLFKDTGWTEEPFLLTKIRFRPPAVDELAREAGIEPGVLDFLRKVGVTTEEELRARLGVRGPPPQVPDNNGVAAEDSGSQDQEAAGAVEAVEKRGASDSTPEVEVEGPAPDQVPKGDPQGLAKGETGDAGAVATGSSTPPGGSRVGEDGAPGAPRGEPGTKGPTSTARAFISYVSADPSEEADPDGLQHAQRLALEEAAIGSILGEEPALHRTPTNNPGFDLVEEDGHGRVVRWVEVKAMTGTLRDRPATMHRAQYAAAQEHGPAYWLYVVERAGTPSAHIVRIQDPAGKTRTFLFDSGWESVAAEAPAQTTATVRDIRDVRLH